jgi:hypothetical protein
LAKLFQGDARESYVHWLITFIHEALNLAGNSLAGQSDILNRGAKKSDDFRTAFYLTLGVA